jgi:hypothetical protein
MTSCHRDFISRTEYLAKVAAVPHRELPDRRSAAVLALPAEDFGATLYPRA